MRVVTVLVKDHDGAAEDTDDQVAGLGVTAAVSTRITIAAGVRVIRSLIFSNLLVFSYLHLLFLVNVFFHTFERFIMIFYYAAKIFIF